MARIALAAGLQGRFWEMHTALMEHPQYVVTDVFVEETAAVYGLNIDQLNRDIRSKTVDKLLKKSDKSINAAGLYSTPSLMIKDKVYTISGESLPKLKDLLDLIAQAEK